MTLSSHQLGLGLNKWGFFLWTEFLSREVDMKKTGPPSPHMYVTEHNHHKFKHLLGDSKSCLTLDAKHCLWSTQAVHISSSSSTPMWTQLCSLCLDSVTLSQLPVPRKKPAASRQQITGFPKSLGDTGFNFPCSL